MESIRGVIGKKEESPNLLKKTNKEILAKREERGAMAKAGRGIV